MSRIAWAKSVLERSLGVPPEDVEVASGRRLLNSLLLGVAGATVLMLAAALVAAGRGTMGVGPQVGELTLGIVVTLCSVVAVSLLRRFRATDLSGPLFLLILLVTIAMSDLPLRAGNGVRLTLLAVPLVIASVLLSPWASLVLSALSIMMLLVIGFRIQPFPNVPAVGAFLMLVAVAWLSTRSLERALEHSRQATHKLRDSEGRYRALFDGVPVGLYRIAPSGQFLDVNLALVGMLGYASRDSLLAVNAADLYTHDGDWKRWQLALQRGEVVHDFEAELRRQDGTRIDVRCSARIWRDADGTMLYYEGSLEDVTERVRAGRLLQALSEASLSMARAITQDSILAAIAQEFQQLGFSCTLLLLDEGRVNLVAHPLHQDMAQPQEGVPTGQGTKALSIPLAAVGPYAQAIHEQKTVFVQSATDGIQQAPPESGVEATGQPASTPQASTFIAAPLVVEAQVIGVLSVESVDLSEEDVPAITAFAQQVAAAWHKAQLMGNLHKSLQELRDTQAQLLQAQKLESLGRLAGGIAHDFSNLLTVMIGYAQLSLRQLKLRHPIHKYVSEIYVATQRATRMTGQLLDFARQQTLHREPVHLGRLIRGFSEMLGPMIGEHIQIELNLAGDLPVLVDRMAFERVLMNLALNARDAMPEGGTLFIATAQVDIDAAYVQSHPEAKPGDYVRVTVSDAGIGMDQATLEHLFEPFFSTKPPDQGIGLGLAVTYGIVKQHEGWITVKSTLGQGTTFQLYIPICLEVVEKTTEESQVLPMLRGQGTVLLAEDETTVRHFMQEVLEGLGYTVLPARDGREAIRVFRDHRDTVDLAILDVVMPKLSGVKVCDALRKLRSDVPVIFITGYSKEIPHLPGPGDTVTRILQKPFGPDQLSLQVREVMEEAVLATALP